MPDRTEPNLDAGALDRRVQLLSPTYNPEGDEIVAWNVVDSVWASVSPTVGMEQTESGRTVAVLQVTMAIRYRPDIDPRWRVSGDGRLWEIVGVVNVLNRRAQLQLNCKEIQ
jgi:SPP1 family predicted phage head-tail adaptor